MDSRRNPVEIFDDTQEIAEALNEIAEGLPAYEAYWLREAAVSLLGMYEDIIELCKGR